MRETGVDMWLVIARGTTMTRVPLPCPKTGSQRGVPPCWSFLSGDAGVGAAVVAAARHLYEAAWRW